MYKAKCKKLTPFLQQQGLQRATDNLVRLSDEELLKATNIT